jgi:hypothetical protein
MTIISLNNINIPQQHKISHHNSNIPLQQYLRSLSLIPGRGILWSPNLLYWLRGPSSVLSMEISGATAEEAAGV